LNSFDLKKFLILKLPKTSASHLKNQLVVMLITTTLFLVTSCNPLGKLKKNEYLLNKNIVKIENKKVDSDELKTYIKQKPNRKVLGIRFHLGIYNIASKGKEGRLKRWLKSAIGEPPVILDTMLTQNSVKQIKLYLHDKGYFNATVCKKILFRKKTADVTYLVNTSTPYTTHNINYVVKDPTMQFLILVDSSNSNIKKGKNYDIDNLQNERERITKYLKNNGYYYFVKQYVNYIIDTTINTSNKDNKQFDITIEIKQNNVSKNDTIKTTNHIRYKINNIYIFSDYNSLKSDTSKYDTLKYSINRKNVIYGKFSYLFVYHNKLKIKPKTFTQSIFIKPNNYYKINELEQTYNRLSDLQLFKFINIGFVQSKSDSLNQEVNNMLDCIIQVTNTPFNSYTLETEGTNSAGDLGIAGNIIYQNKNTFRGAEIFLTKLKLAMEFQKQVGETDNNKLSKTIEAGLETSIKFPKFLVPVKQEKFAKSANPKTYVTLGFNFQKRKEFTRYISNIIYGYEWKESKFKKHIFNPFEISSIKSKITDSIFEAELIKKQDPKLINNYQRGYLIAATTYSYIFSNQEINKIKNFTYFKGELEFAGNFLQFKNNLLHSPKNENDNFTLVGIEYAQFFKANADVRKYFVINKANKVVFRIAAGLGIPYGNSEYLPLDKSFYAGGANSIRAWKIRSLGPGSYHDSSSVVFDKSGDIYLEGNMEYRFKIYGDLGGALFADAGNVWLEKENPKYLNGDFKFNRFYKEIALGTGLGLRYDFGFFVIRFDVATPIYNPSYINNRWKGFKTYNFNFAIGYPF